jgi:hypothetical protein
MTGSRHESTEDSPSSTHVMPPRSRYAGQPLDASSRHSITISSGANDATLIPANATHATVDFFFHAGSYWRALIPLDGVRELCGQAFNFSKPRMRRGPTGPEILRDRQGLPKRTVPLLNHVQCRFAFESDQPVQLFPMNAGEEGEAAHRIHDFVYSLEAVGPQGISFNLRDAVSGNLISAHRFLSTQEMVFERIVVENQCVTESPPLPLDSGQRRSLLVKSLLRSHAAGMTETYYLYRVCGTNNCTSSPLQILDQVVAYRGAARLGAALYRLPISPRFYLRVRGLDADPTLRKLVRTEFDEYIQDPATQQRKRDHVRRLTSQRRAARDARKS